jgi:signal transduction histidine kinase
MTGLRRALIGIAVAGIVLGAVAAIMILGSEHMDFRGGFASIGLALGWSFIGTGLFAWYRRPDNGSGALMVSVGFSWFVSGLFASDISAVFAVGFVLNNLFYAALIHLLLAFPQGQLVERAHRRLVAAGYVIAVVPQAVAALFVETPFEDCERCPENPLLITDSPAVVELSFMVQALTAIPLFILVGRVIVQRRRRAQGAERAALAPVVWAGLLTLAAAGFQLAALVAGSEGAAMVFFMATLLAIAAVPYGFLVGLLRGRMSRAAAVSDLVERLGGRVEDDSEIRDALAEALDDPDLALVYWLPDGERWVDCCGRPAADPYQMPAVATTTVRHNGEQVAALVHDPRLTEEPGLLETAGAAAGLALQNQQLEAAVRARVDELEASRARIVEASDTARRRLERDLHDGAQQRLVALALDLRLARARVESDPTAAAELLDASIRALAEATDELRELARGIHPPLLTERGLGPALDALASRAPLPVEFGEMTSERLPGPVESAAYFVVAEALTNVAKYSEATHAEVSVARDNGSLVVEVRDDGVGGANPDAGTGLRGLADRVGALDGKLEVQSPQGHGTIVRAEVPCE